MRQSRTVGASLPKASGRTEDRAEAGAFADLWLDRREPARDAAVQRVVVECLVVGLVRLSLNGTLSRGGVAACRRRR